MWLEASAGLRGLVRRGYAVSLGCAVSLLGCIAPLSALAGCGNRDAVGMDTTLTEPEPEAEEEPTPSPTTNDAGALPEAPVDDDAVQPAPEPDDPEPDGPSDASPSPDAGSLPAAGEGLPEPQLAASVGGTCSIGDQRQLYCWGSRLDGAEWTAPAGEFRAVQASEHLFCALPANGTEPPVCFRPPESTQELPAYVPDFPVGTLAINEAAVCGIDAEGEAFCREAPDFADAPFMVPREWTLEPPAGASFVALSAGTEFACGLDAESAVRCWGNPGGTADCANSRAVGQLDAPDGEFTQLSSSRLTTCGITVDGAVECWGAGSDPESMESLCGVPLDLDQGLPPDGSDFAKVSVSNSWSCALRLNGELACWGINSLQCDEVACEPAPVPPGPFVEIAVAEHHACAMKADRSVTCFGTVPNYLQVPAEIRDDG